MKFGSVCSGIEAASCAWQPLGWEAQFVSEIEPFPCSVLAHHYPTVPNLGDMTKFKEWGSYDIDVLVGGTPCQSFSVAGLRKGLADPRGNLMLTYLAIAGKYRPRWLVWENVPGVHSAISHSAPDPSPPPPPVDMGCDGQEMETEDEYQSEEVHAFQCFLAGLSELRYGFAYRVLNAEYFGVAQRRRRVFVVGCLGDWRRAAAVLFERHSLQGHPAPRREAREVAPTISSRSLGGGGLGTDFDCDGGLVPMPHADISPALKARDGKGPSSDGDGDGAILVPMLAHALRGEGFDASEDGTGRGTPLVPVAQPYTLAIRGRGDSHNLEYRQDGTANALLTPNGGRGGIGVGAIAFDCKASGQNGFGVGEIASTQRAMGHSSRHANGGGHQAVMTGMQVRRLTPMECERLQGFRDNYTNVPHHGKPAADGPRYKALGNSMAVPVMAWIGKRIQTVDAIKREQVAA